MNEIQLERLRELYSKNSKHSGYQLLAPRLVAVLGQNPTRTQPRYEPERLEYILGELEVKGRRVLDIGGNTGYFSFQLLDHGASCVQYYEGYKPHAEFVAVASAVLGLEDKVKVTARYLDFDDELQGMDYDVILLLNVLHHVGDDYGRGEMSRETAKQAILDQLNSLANSGRHMAFQLGFNWKGDRTAGLFDHGTKEEMIDYIKKGVEGFWQVVNIGIAVKTGGRITYQGLNQSNIQRDDQLGEFLNRPLFILRSKIKK